MSPDLSIQERDELFKLVDGHSALSSALQKFFDYECAEYRAKCTDAMASLPRRTEYASDCAAKAQEHESMWAKLGALARRSG